MTKKQKPDNATDVEHLNEAWKKAVKANEDMRTFRRQHNKLVLEFEALKSSVERTTEMVKACVHPLARHGETRTIIDDNQGTVTVTGPLGSPEYDLGKAMQGWSKEVLMKVLMVDRKSVEAAVKLGDLDAAAAKKAELPRQPLSPRAKVEFK